MGRHLLHRQKPRGDGGPRDILPPAQQGRDDLPSAGLPGEDEFLNAMTLLQDVERMIMALVMSPNFATFPRSWSCPANGQGMS
jgi:hypothetical protein